MGDALGPTTGRPTGESASAMQQQSDRADLFSVGFSTRSARMQAACPSCNTPTDRIARHFSAHGIPDRLCVVRSACGSTQWNARTRPRPP